MMKALLKKKRDEVGAAVILNTEIEIIRPQLSVFFERLFFFYGLEAGKLTVIMLMGDNGVPKISCFFGGGICIPLTYGPYVDTPGASGATAGSRGTPSRAPDATFKRLPPGELARPGGKREWVTS